MDKTKSSTGNLAKFLKLAVVGLLLIVIAGVIFGRRYMYVSRSVETTEQIVGLAKTTSPEDRQAWLL
ncbi:MAG: hypothetical protein KA368_09685, partial [Acidobacteria bacterium]|nr:hypothetical protein [Acidobacteriota bacterium]